MGRLIDEDELKENLVFCNGLGRRSCELVCECLKKTQTASDKKIIKTKLRQFKTTVKSEYDGEEIEVINLQRAEEIVDEY